MTVTNNKYLGDGVYASFNGFQIWLKTSDSSRVAIALEPEVFKSLVEYADEYFEKDNEVIIDDSAENEVDELYTTFYVCPACKDNHITRGSNYCSSCGKKVIFNLANYETKRVD
jgi:predicted RNA-binding Zn-ribbon protein involved in translation (DUF1610 family)